MWAIIIPFSIYHSRIQFLSTDSRCPHLLGPNNSEIFAADAREIVEVTRKIPSLTAKADSLCSVLISIPPKFNSSPLKSYPPNRKVVFQPPFFRGKLLNFGGVTLWDFQHPNCCHFETPNWRCRSPHWIRFEANHSGSQMGSSKEWVLEEIWSASFLGEYTIVLIGFQVGKPDCMRKQSKVHMFYLAQFGPIGSRTCLQAWFSHLHIEIAYWDHRSHPFDHFREGIPIHTCVPRTAQHGEGQPLQEFPGRVSTSTLNKSRVLYSTFFTREINKQIPI